MYPPNQKDKHEGNNKISRKGVNLFKGYISNMSSIDADTVKVNHYTFHLNDYVIEGDVFPIIKNDSLKAVEIRIDNHNFNDYGNSLDEYIKNSREYYIKNHTKEHFQEYIADKIINLYKQKYGKPNELCESYTKVYNMHKSNSKIYEKGKELKDIKKDCFYEWHLSDRVIIIEKTGVGFCFSCKYGKFLKDIAKPNDIIINSLNIVYCTHDEYKSIIQDRKERIEKKRKKIRLHNNKENETKSAI